jgi:hypothetical protein
LLSSAIKAENALKEKSQEGNIIKTSDQSGDSTSINTGQMMGGEDFCGDDGQSFESFHSVRSGIIGGVE